MMIHRVIKFKQRKSETHLSNLNQCHLVAKMTIFRFELQKRVALSERMQDLTQMI